MGEVVRGGELCTSRGRCVGWSYLCVQALKAVQFPDLVLVACPPLWFLLEIQTHTQIRLFTFMWEP